MVDYSEGIKREVAEVKFLIHDLRVERFINEVIHFHVTVNTDLEIYSVEQARILHGHDLQVLKAKAVSLRKAYQDYSNAVKSYSPHKTILLAGRNYIETIRNICALILNPLWGRIDKVLDFLPEESRSARSYQHYRNCIHWIGGVSRRIEHFLDEEQNKDICETFDLGAELEDFTRSVAQPYVTEKSGATVELRLDRLDPAPIRGNRYRFRRMYFNLIMNSVDAMADRKVGTINVSDTVGGDRVLVRVRDNGSGMTGEKIQQLLTDRETLDGELDSLGFVFVRQTIAEFDGDLSIESAVGEGTTVTVSIPLADREASAHAPDGPEEEAPLSELEGALSERGPASAGEGVAPAKPLHPHEEDKNACGRLVYGDYQSSEAQFPGSIFAISIGEGDAIDYFTHRPYDRYWNMSHEDLSPMYFQSIVRGRLEQDDLKRPLLILKDPQSVAEYFEFKNVPEKERTPERHLQMVHDEYIRIARKLIDTGLSPQITVELSGLQRFFAGRDELWKAEPFPLGFLASQALTTEKNE